MILSDLLHEYCLHVSETKTLVTGNLYSLADL